jgi:predicted metal-dependent peptidase
MIDKLTKARTGLVLDHPFFGSLILRMRMIEDNNIETMCTNGKTIRYNKSFVDELTNDKLKGLLCHEVMHIACMHHLRRGNRDLKDWNIAGDYVINQILIDSGEVLPECGLIDPRYKDMSTEAVYAEIQRNKLPDQPKGKGGGEGDSYENKESDSGEGEGDESTQDNQQQQQQQQQRKTQEKASSWGEVEDATTDDGEALNESERSQAEQEVKIAVAQAVNQAKMMGNGNGALRAFAEDMLTPKIDWADELRKFITDIAKNEYSWMPPNRRYIHKNIYLPSCKSEVLKEAIIVVDTSGSVDDAMVRQFIGEFNSILNTIKFEKIHLWSCDTQVYQVGEFDMAEEITFNKLPGGGGTDFRPPFDLVDELGLQPSVMIYLTDMYCWSYPTEPNYPVLWGRYGNNKDIAPFGETIQIN